LIRKLNISMLYRALLVLYIITAIISSLPVKLPGSLNTEFNERRLLISYQAVTGPEAVILKGNDPLKHSFEELYPNINNSAVELVGNTPMKELEYPSYYEADFIVYGRAVSVTSEYIATGDGIVPIYEVYKWQPDRYLPNFLTSTKLSWLTDFMIIITPIFVLITIVLLITNIRKRIDKVN